MKATTPEIVAHTPWKGPADVRLEQDRNKSLASIGEEVNGRRKRACFSYALRVVLRKTGGRASLKAMSTLVAGGTFFANLSRDNRGTLEGKYIANKKVP